MRIAPLLSVPFLLALATFASAGSPDGPEMPDNTGDVDPLALAGLRPDELDDVRGNLSMYDLEKAYVTAENAVGFWFVVMVVDLDGGLGTTQTPVPPPAPPPTPTQVATFDVHFRSGDQGFVARATLEPKRYVDPSQQPPVVFAYFASNFTLHKDDAEGTFLRATYGLVSPKDEAIMLYVPKETIGDPAVGSKMEGLYTVSATNGTALDFAPDAALDPTAVDPSKPLSPGLKPQAGLSYEFGQYPGSGAPPKLRLEANGNTTLWAKTGETVAIPVTLENIGERDLEVRMGLMVPRKWIASVEPETLNLTVGSSQVVVVRVSPEADAGKQGTLRVAASSGFETQTVAYTLKHGDPDAVETTPVTEPAGGKKKDSPGLGAAGVVVAMGVLAVLWRRR